MIKVSIEGRGEHIIHFAGGMHAGRRAVWTGVHPVSEACDWATIQDAVVDFKICNKADHAWGVSVCKPPDQFVAEVGRKLALTNLFRRQPNLFTQKERTQIWKAYHGRRPARG